MSRLMQPEKRNFDPTNYTSSEGRRYRPGFRAHIHTTLPCVLPSTTAASSPPRTHSAPLCATTRPSRLPLFFTDEPSLEINQQNPHSPSAIWPEAGLAQQATMVPRRGSWYGVPAIFASSPEGAVIGPRLPVDRARLPTLLAKPSLTCFVGLRWSLVSTSICRSVELAARRFSGPFGRILGFRHFPSGVMFIGKLERIIIYTSPGKMMPRTDHPNSPSAECSYFRGSFTAKESAYVPLR